MKKIGCFFCLICLSIALHAVQPGIADVVRYSSLWKGKKVGFVGNQTSVVNGEHSLDFLRSRLLPFSALIDK